MSPYSLSFGQDTYGKQTVFGPRRIGRRRKRAAPPGGKAARQQKMFAFFENECNFWGNEVDNWGSREDGFGGAPFVKRFNTARFSKEKVVAAVETENGECSVRSDGGCRDLLTVGALCGNIELAPHGVLVLRK